MLTLNISPKADSDLNEIGHYLGVEQHNPEAANRIIQSIMETLLLLPQFPQLGKSCTEFTDLIPNLMFLTAEGYLLYYRCDEDSIDVIRIVHSHRERRRVLEV